MNWCTRAACTAALLLLSACSDEPQPVTELAVWISADRQVSDELAAVKIGLFRDDEARALVVEHVFALARVPDSAPALLFSFGLVDQGPGTFILAAEGCSDSAACRRILIEHKVRVRFAARKTLQFHVHFEGGCAGASVQCPGLEHTCRLNGEDGERAGCVSVPLAQTEALPGPELKIPTVIDAAGASGATATDAGSDSGASGAQCPDGDMCLEPYRCIRHAGGGDECQGQFARWPMPDALPGARQAPSYDVQTTTGVVYDNVTGLSWQRFLPERYAGCSQGFNAPGDSCSWSEARDYCAKLELAGLRWRLPTLIELASLVDYRATIPTLDLEIFAVTSQNMYWTASPHSIAERPEPSKYYVWSFTTGMFAAAQRASANVVRCVHASDSSQAPLPDHYADHKVDNLILDSYTGLTWLGAVVCRRDLSFAEAEEFCSNIPWHMRVPSIKELLTLIDPMKPRASNGASAPFVDPLFSERAVGATFWSSTESKPFSGKYLLLLDQPAVVDETILTSLLQSLDSMTSAPSGADTDAGAQAGPTHCVRCVE